jgi:Ketopantoate hydroxymethyltransferase
MLPQHIREEGGYKVKGRTSEEAGSLRDDAAAVQAAGAFAVVLEIITPALAAEIGPTLQIPTIGIGSGEGCDGQILVLHDLVGLYPWFKPNLPSNGPKPRRPSAAQCAHTPPRCTEGSK